MPIIKKNEVMPERPVIITLYGTPGAGKTSTACTSDAPLLIDTDRGATRAISRVDTLVANNWNDIVKELDSMKEYKTVIVDTVRSVLEDFLVTYVCNMNYKLKTNTLKRFGELADQFKEFVNKLRSYGVDIIFIAHDKETAEGDIIKHSPDCIGQSKDLLLRISDEVGYITMVNGKRTILWEPTDTTTGKNVANFPAMEVPAPTDPKYGTFMANVVSSVKTSLINKSEAQRKANEQITKLRKELADIEDEEGAAKLLVDCKELPQIMKQPFFNEITVALAAKGFTWDGKKFAKPSTEKKPADGKKEAKKEEEKKPADGKEKAVS